MEKDYKKEIEEIIGGMKWREKKANVIFHKLEVQEETEWKTGEPSIDFHRHS